MSQELDPDTSLEIFILLILGLFMVLFGALLFGIDDGRLPYNPDSTYGLFLVILSFQAVTLGKTPFGDFARSWLLVIIGVCAATVGLFGSFIPGVSSDFLRTLVGVIVLGGGIALAAQLWTSEQKARAWLQVGGALRHLTIACSLVYALAIILGIRTLLPAAELNLQTAVMLLAFGISLFYLAGSIWQVRRLYPADWHARGTGSAASRTQIGILQPAPIPLPQALVILFGLVDVLLGVLLFPVGVGLLPFSPDGQFGVVLTVMAIKAACLGQLPVGQFQRSWPIMAIGMTFAAAGIVSSIVPGLLTDALRILLGVLNIASGGTSLIRQHLPILDQARSAAASPAAVPVEVKRLAINQTAQSCAAIAFGLGALVPGLIPILLVAGILVVYGLLLFDQAFLLHKLAKVSPTLQPG